MKQLLRTTTAYRLYLRDAEEGSTAHTTLVLFPDAVYLRALLLECAKAFFGAEEGGRVARLLEEESFSDCLFFPPKGEKYTADLAASIVEESMLRPVEGQKKLFVLDDFGSATPLVQNKLLKLLEEPPAGVFFLLGAADEHALLATVLSRAKKLSVPPFSEEEVYAALRRQYEKLPDLKEAAAASGGLYSVAEALLSDGGTEFSAAEELLLTPSPEALCRSLGDVKEKKPYLSALRLVLRDALFLSVGQEKYCARRGQNLNNISLEYPAGALIAGIGFVADAEREIQFNANFGQALLSFAVRIREEKARWQTLS